MFFPNTYLLNRASRFKTIFYLKTLHFENQLLAFEAPHSKLKETIKMLLLFNLNRVNKLLKPLSGLKQQGVLCAYFKYTLHV